MEVLKQKNIVEKLQVVLDERHSFYFYNNFKQTPKFLPFLNEKIKNFKKQNIQFKKTNLNFAAMENMAMDFFEEFDGELAGKIWNVLEDETTVMQIGKPSERGGINAVGVKDDDVKRTALGKPAAAPARCKKNIHVEIQLHPTDDVCGLIAVVHEFAHLTEQRVQEKISQKADCLGEIAPMFMELVFVEHLFKTGVIDENEKEMFLKKREESFVSNVRLLLEEDEILSNLSNPITMQQLERLEEKYNNTPRGEILNQRILKMIDASNHLHGEHCFRYIVGEIASQLLFEQYMKNQNLTKDNFKIFVGNNAKMTEKQAFDTLFDKDFVFSVKEFLQTGNRIKD